eukprot:scaffold54429_cov28-Tisochrysis_lutea.AAC.1
MDARSFVSVKVDGCLVLSGPITPVGGRGHARTQLGDQGALLLGCQGRVDRLVHCIQLQVLDVHLEEVDDARHVLGSGCLRSCRSTGPEPCAKTALIAAQRADGPCKRPACTCASLRQRLGRVSVVKPVSINPVPIIVVAHALWKQCVKIGTIKKPLARCEVRVCERLIKPTQVRRRPHTSPPLPDQSSAEVRSSDHRGTAAAAMRARTALFRALTLPRARSFTCAHSLPPSLPPCLSLPSSLSPSGSLRGGLYSAAS